MFDLDGVLIESEQVWDEVRREVVRELGGRWKDGATRAMQGMSSPEWSRYVRDELGVALPPERIAVAVVGRLRERYRRELPLLPGAVEAVRRMAVRWPLAMASSSNRELIDDFVAASGLGDAFRVTVSSEEVARGKPAPDVYLEAARRLGFEAAACAAVEDSVNGLRSALAAGMTVVGIPNRQFPPPPDVLDRADVVIANLDALQPELLEHA